MSFEEVGAFLAAYKVDVRECEESLTDPEVTHLGRGFAQSGGVREAVAHATGERYSSMSVDGLNKQNIALLKSMIRKPQAQFVEVMACPGGCINGPSSLAPLSLARKNLKQSL